MTPSLLEECWQLVNQLVRDDYASIGTVAYPEPNSSGTTEIPPIDEHSADWSCISVALGPLFCLYSRMLRSSPYVTDMDLRQRRSLLENSRIAEQVQIFPFFFFYFSMQGMESCDFFCLNYLVVNLNLIAKIISHVGWDLEPRFYHKTIGSGFIKDQWIIAIILPHVFVI